jgi:hypothetical protein
MRVPHSHSGICAIASVLPVCRSYEKERRPIAVQNADLSMNNFRDAMAVPAALGL